MRKLATWFLTFFALSTFGATSQGRSITFEGQAAEGQSYRKSIGPGLDFVLMPNQDWTTGWIIKILPDDNSCDLSSGDFLSIATPPYHFQNMRYLDTQYGITAQEAVRNSPREFSFVLNCADFETESKWLDLVIYPYIASKQEVDDALSKLGSSPLGKGRLWIEDSKITPGHTSDRAEDLGAIHWIKFKVEVKFPAERPRHPKG